MSSVKYFHSAMTGAPSLNNAAGAMIALLDACLVNGFGLKTLDSLVVSGGIATGTVSTGHSFEADTIAEIAGATPSGLNGQKRILSVSGNSFTFDATGISNQTATGTITAKLAAAGWSKPYTGTNVAVFRSNNVAGTRQFLRVDDAAGVNAFVRGYEAMTDAVGTGQAAFPTVAQQSGSGLFWLKSNTGSPATARPWVLIGDDRTFYLWVQTNVSATPFIIGGLMGFGDMAPMKAGDPFACFLSGFTGDLTGLTTGSSQDLTYSHSGSAPGSIFMPRSYTGIGGSVSVLQRAEAYWSTNGWSATTSNQICNYPNATDNALLLNRLMVIEPLTPTLRGTMRGMLHTPQICNSFFSTRQKIDGRGAYSGRKLLTLSSNAPSANQIGAIAFFDITGPWG